MEELNKTQIVLLTIFVTFVTSIATGIVTVTLLSQAPPGITNVIDHVVEKTIEKVVPAAVTGQTATVVRESVKVINSEDLTIAAIDRNQKSIWRIHGIPTGGSDSSEVTFYGFGFVLSKEGVLVADSSAVGEGISYRANDVSGKVFKLEFLKTDLKRRLAFFKIISTEKDKPDLVPVSITDANTLKIGQTVIAMGGRDKSNSVSVGIISSLDQDKSDATGANAVTTIYTTTDLKPLYVGSLLINTSGEVTGFYRYVGEYGNYFPLPSVRDMTAIVLPQGAGSTTPIVR